MVIEAHVTEPIFFIKDVKLIIKRLIKFVKTKSAMACLSLLEKIIKGPSKIKFFVGLANNYNPSFQFSPILYFLL